jgi:hypothetical protein
VFISEHAVVGNEIQGAVPGPASLMIVPNGNG